MLGEYKKWCGHVSKKWYFALVLFYRIDSVSGSLKQSEPCSPQSPGSPDPTLHCDRRPTSPHTISKALSNLQRSELSFDFILTKKKKTLGHVDDMHFVGLVVFVRLHIILFDFCFFLSFFFYFIISL